jgi:hypothetical protein
MDWNDASVIIKIEEGNEAKVSIEKTYVGVSYQNNI